MNDPARLESLRTDEEKICAFCSGKDDDECPESCREALDKAIDKAIVHANAVQGILRMPPMRFSTKKKFRFRRAHP